MASDDDKEKDTREICIDKSGVAAGTVFVCVRSVEDGARKTWNSNELFLRPHEQRKKKAHFSRLLILLRDISRVLLVPRGVVPRRSLINTVTRPIADEATLPFSHSGD